MIEQINIEAIKQIARDAGDEILTVYGTEFSVDIKEDKSPLTEADRRGNDVIVKALEAQFPEVPIISEETKTVSYDERKDWEYFWLVDPLDGTKDFLQGTGEYAVHLALVHQQRPVLGVVLVPEREELWIGVVGSGTWCENRSGERAPVRFSARAITNELILVASRSHRDQRLEQLITALELGESKAVGSVGCKVATILRGETDLYISLSGKSAPKDWDMAAPEAVLLAAGGAFTHADGAELTYNTGDVRQAGCLIASHGKTHAALCEKATRAMGLIDPGFQV